MWRSTTCSRLIRFPDLTTVDENETIEEQLQRELIPEIRPFDRAPTEETQHGRRNSSATLNTTFSMEEMQELDPDIMVDVLPSLASAAGELAKLLVPADLKTLPAICSEIRTVGTKYNKLFNNRMAALYVHKRSFGSTEYIQPSTVLRKLFGVQNMNDVPVGPWRPDNVIYGINLATMLRSVLIVLSPVLPVGEDGYKDIEALDVNFGSGIAGPIFSEDAFQMCLAIVRQLSIIRVARYYNEGGFRPGTAVRRIFFMQEHDVELHFRHQKVLHMLSLSRNELQERNNVLQNAASEVIDLFDDDDDSTWVPALNELRARYPWEQFIEHVVQYHLMRKQELDGQIDAAGGMDELIAGLSQEVERRSAAREANEKRVSLSRPRGTPKKGFTKAGIKALKAREKQLEASAAAALAAAPASVPVAQMTDPALTQQPAPVDDGWHPLDNDDQLQPPPQSGPQPTARSLADALATLQEEPRPSAAKGKGRSLLDPQANAQRVAWTDFESQVSDYAVPPTFQYPTSGQQQGPYYRSPNKRPHTAVEEDDGLEDFEPTQDRGFEVDTRDTAAADQRRRQAPQPTRAPQPTFSSAAPASSAPIVSQASPRPQKVARQSTSKNPGSSIPAPPPPFDPDHFGEIPQDQRIQRAKLAARFSTIRATQQKPAQVRTPWTEDEESALMELIEEHGEDKISYSKLKAADQDSEQPRLNKRSAEDMRFKSRNMKETFLK
jgi:hypothetical protein